MATVSRPTITIYDKACLKRFFGDYEVVKLLEPVDFDVQILNDQKIIALSIESKFFNSNVLPCGESPLQSYIQILNMEYQTEIEERIAQCIKETK